MDTQDKRDLDRIINVLYKTSPQAWYKIYTDLGISKDRAEHLFKIAFAFNYLQIEHKGALEYPTDNQYVGITDEGIRFFALSNFSGTEKTVEIAGQNYRPKKIHTVKIFENASKLTGRELKNMAREQGSKRGFLERFYSDEDLEGFGDELTMSLIGNAQFGSGKQTNAEFVLPKVGHRVKEVHNNQTTNASENKPIFISYSWESQQHEDHVFSFADEMRKSGFNVDIDKIINQRKTSTNFNQMMHEAFLQSEHIIVVLSEGYKTKADSFQGGVGVEYRLILGEIDRLPLKYILVSFNGRSESIIPLGLGGRDIIDLSLNNGLESLYRKLTGQHEYVLSPVSADKPILPSRKIAAFSEHQNAIIGDKKPDYVALTAQRIEKKKKLRKDLSTWLDYKKEDVKKHFRMIIHSAEKDTYPDQPMIPKVPATWFGAEIHGSSHLGIEFCDENSQLYIDSKGNWSHMNLEGLYPVSVSVIKTIAYDDIVTWDMDGDGIYNCPHFYVKFVSGEPWTDTYYINSNKKHIRLDSSNQIETV